MGWNDKLTRLNRILAELYPRQDQSRRIVDMAGVPPGGISFKDAATENWYYILQEAHRRKKVNDLVQIISNEYPEREDLKDLYQDATHQKVMQTAEEYKINELKQLVRNGKTKAALELMEKIAASISNDFHNSIINLSGRHNRLINERNNGTIEAARYDIEANRINMALLHYIDKIGYEQQLNAALNALNKEIDAPQTININIPDSSELEKTIGKEALFEINWVEKAMRASKSICKIERSDGIVGTGFVVPGGHLLTANHVLPNAQQAADARIIFNYQINASGDAEPTSEYRLDPSVFAASSETKLDYTLVKIASNGSTPLEKWGTLKLDDFSDPQTEDVVTIIQHPEGKSMKIALPDKIISVWRPYVFYVADTRNGSSGSPVFNQYWKVIALHHAGKNEKDAGGGMKINAAGDIRPANRGILIKPILKDLHAKGIHL